MLHQTLINVVLCQTFLTSELTYQQELVGSADRSVVDWGVVSSQPDPCTDRRVCHIALQPQQTGDRPVTSLAASTRLRYTESTQFLSMAGRISDWTIF